MSDQQIPPQRSLIQTYDWIMLLQICSAFLPGRRKKAQGWAQGYFYQQTGNYVLICFDQPP